MDNVKATLPEVWQLSQRLSSAQLEAAVQAYVSGEGTRDVARDLDISKSALLDLLREQGVPIRAHTLLSEHDIIEAAELYGSGLLLREVAERFGVSTECIRKRLGATGVTMRPGIGGRAGGPRRK